MKIKTILSTLLAIALFAEPVTSASAAVSGTPIDPTRQVDPGKVDWSTSVPRQPSIIPNIQRAVRDGALLPEGIVGGTTATIATAPWQVALINVTDYSTDFDGQFCGGSIIAAKWILTAAHCADVIYYTEDLQILSGTATLSRSGFTDSNLSTVAGIYMHPNYDSYAITDDIALIELDQPLDLVDNVREIINLPAANVTVGTNLTVTGWGSTTSDGQTPAATLRTSTQRVVSPTTCELEYGDSFSVDYQVCVGISPYDTVAACQGDSGGPAAALVGGTPTLIGLTSYGSSSGCTEGIPSVFTKIYAYRDWLASEMGPVIETSNSLISGASESVEVTVKDLMPGDQELFLDDGFTQTSLGVGSPSLNNGWYVTTFVLDLSDPALSSLGMGTFSLTSTNAETGQSGYGELYISDGSLDYAVLTISDSTVYPKADGYKDTVDITAEVASSQGSDVIEDLGPGSTIVVKKGNTVIKSWPVTSTGFSTVTWNGKKGSRIVKGAYTVQLTAYGLNGVAHRDTATINVSKKKLVWKTWKKKYKGSKFFKYYESYDYTACTLSGASVVVYVGYYEAACYGMLGLKSSWMNYSAPKISVKMKVKKFYQGGNYGGFLVSGATGDMQIIRKNKTYKWNMGYITDPLWDSDNGRWVVLPMVYVPGYAYFQVANISFTVKYQVLK